MKDAYYFPHDSNAKDDPKIVLLIEQLGLEGFGIYWVLIETLRDQPDYRYPLKLLPAIARKYVTTAEKVEAVVKYYHLFEIENDKFFLSPSLCRRMAVVDSKRRRLSEAGKRGRAKQLQASTGHPQAMPEPPPGSKEKKRKGKEKKKKEIFDPSSLIPSGVSEDLWRDFLANRKHKNLQNTERALKTIISSFEKGLDQYSYDEMIETYISTNMQRFDPLWMKSTDNKASNKTPDYLKGVK